MGKILTSPLKISVVTVCWNSAGTIRHALDSFARQDYPAKELLVVDGASSDGTLKVIEEYAAENVWIVSEPDHGIYDAMNKGLRLFTGDAVGFLNSDDRYRDGHVLSRIADALTTSDIVHGNVDFLTDFNSARLVRRWRGSPFSRGSFAAGWMPPHPTFYTRRSVIDAVGAFDQRYRMSADYDFMLRALELNDFSSAFIDEALVEMTYGGASTAGLRAQLKHNWEALQSRRAWLGSGLIDRALIAKPMRKLRQFFPRGTIQPTAH